MFLFNLCYLSVVILILMQKIETDTTKTFYLLKTPENLITNLQMHLFKAVQF